MCNAWNHSYDCTCGWGGTGIWVEAEDLEAAGSAEHLTHLGSLRTTGCRCPSLSAQLGHSVTFPANCWYCGQLIFLYSHPNGGFAVFDELGWPWPKHDCPRAGFESFSAALRQKEETFSIVPKGTKYRYAKKNEEIIGSVIEVNLRTGDTVKSIHALYTGDEGVIIDRMQYVPRGTFIRDNVSRISSRAVMEYAHIILPSSDGEETC